MAVPTQLSDLSETAASNSPAGTDTVGTTMDDFIRAHASIIARISAGTDALATPALGAATATTVNKITFTQPATGATVTIGNGKTLTVNGNTTLNTGISDTATAVALSLSGSGANSVTIANSATNPTIGTSGGAISFNPIAQGEALRVTTGGASTVNYWALSGALTGSRLTLLATGSDINVGASWQTKGSGSHLFVTETGASAQVEILHTASADRYITLTGSNGGNPTIGTSGGSLAIAVPLIGAGGIQAKSATATLAGGAVGFYMGSDSIGIYFGSGAPTVSAAKGSLYLRSDGTTTNNRMYVNTDGGTTWTAVTTAA